VTGPSSNASISSWINYLAEKGSVSDTAWFAQVDRKSMTCSNLHTISNGVDKVYGGVISSVPANATAFAQRDAFLVYQLYASSSNHAPPYPADGISFVDGMLAALEPNPQGAYSNYIDPTLTTDEWHRLYFGDHVQRLMAIKAALDPKDVFKFSEGF
jgi:FAD/FMN-containing dehydrogenase